jgi:hypothetical protein
LIIFKKIPIQPILKINKLKALHTIFYAEINESLKVNEGGGNHEEGEYIQLYELPEANVKVFMNDDAHPKPPGLLFALQWFLHDRLEFLSNLKNDI